MYDFDQDQHENEENSLSSFSANPLTHNNNAPSFVALLVSAVILLVVAVFGTIVLTSNLTKQVKSEDPKKKKPLQGLKN